MNNNFQKEVELIKKVYDKLITTTNDEIAYNLYKKCNDVFDRYESSNDVDTFRELSSTTSNLIDFRSYIKEYYPSNAYSNINVKENNKVKELSNGKSILDKENVA